MKLWMVETEEQDDHTNHGLYSTKELAEQAVETLLKRWADDWRTVIEARFARSINENLAYYRRHGIYTVEDALQSQMMRNRERVIVREYEVDAPPVDYPEDQ